jgi:hypothetical protein
MVLLVGELSSSRSWPPHLDGCILGTGNDLPFFCVAGLSIRKTGGRPAQGSDSLGVAAIGQCALSCSHIPDLDSGILGTGSDPATVRGPGDGIDRLGVVPVGADFLLYLAR